MNHTPGPWTCCHEAKCPCKQIWSENYPIAIVTSGKWGDDYPAIRLNTDKGTIGAVAEAYMEQITYGEIYEETARANARLIASAPELLEALELIMRCSEKGFIDLKPPWHNKVRRAIRKAKGD